MTISDPATGRAVTKDLIPDAVFGLEYHTNEGSRFRFFAVEADRATEPATSKNLNRKSFERSLLQYQEYIGEGRYRDHLGLTAPLFVVNVSASPKRTDTMIAVTENLSGGTGPAYMLFRTCNVFGPVFRPPEPIARLLTGQWQRAGRSGFVIIDP